MDHRSILVVEDDVDIADLVALHLRDAGYAVTTVRDGKAGLDRAVTHRFDLLILDLALPGLNGLEVCRRLRARAHALPILMLTARSDELDRVLGLELGADDYLTKPFSVRELVARVRALLRRLEAVSRHHVRHTGPLTFGQLRIDPESREVQMTGDSVELTAKEFDLLLHFARHPGRVFTRAQLLDAVWEYGHDGYEHTVNTHINRLRRKIEPDPAAPRFVTTVWGVGYKFRGDCELAGDRAC